MMRTPGLKRLVAVLGAIWMVNGIASAQPTGPANLPQILNVRTFQGIGGSEQRTFLTTDFFTVEATLYDPDPNCEEVPPAQVQFLLFNLEGQLLLTFFGGSESFFGAGPQYSLLFSDRAPGDIPAGAYDGIFVVNQCEFGDGNIFVSGFYPIRVFNP